MQFFLNKYTDFFFLKKNKYMDFNEWMILGISNVDVKYTAEILII